ncbi:calmodulin-binding protein, putative [Bodo saltans]|uniref:Calmodulin-binding protein, putative n=1 Tax=Bodo saltans TaxID=75058 RepID=A0A0S4J2X9_BODSA|nr:calmodulin-binding protein, putative [Bodo saltans]|eukprot:CUG62275.1 calmodulin-binding protein, putative [Bodo saltans]
MQKPFENRQPNISAARLNHAQIKEQEQLNKERVRNDEFKQERQNALVQRQRAQFDHVTSHGYGTKAPPKQNDATPVDDVEIRVFVRECDPDAQAFSFFESQATPAQQPAAQAPRSGRAQPAPGAVLFGRRASAEERRAPQPQSRELAGPTRGEVPAYLVKRKAEMQNEKQMIVAEMERQKELAQYPPGHRPVSEEERRAILDKLSQRKKELENEIGHLPMRFDTIALRQKRQQLETEMAEVEAAQQKFSVKKQLFVPI